MAHYLEHNYREAHAHEMATEKAEKKDHKGGARPGSIDSIRPPWAKGFQKP